MPSGRAREVVSAGAVVLAPGRRVLLVHRPRYDDWSFPKGKLDRGEHLTAAAVREVEEETGLRVRLGVPLADQTYPVRGGTKRVHYWVGRPVRGPRGAPDPEAAVAAYEPNAEIDAVGWFPVDEARRRLTHEVDVGTLDEALAHPRATRTLVVLRHSQARSRQAWRDDDRRRPLLASGQHRAGRLAPVLAAYDVRRLVTSSSTRCVQTLEPYAAASGHRLHLEDLLSEEDARRDVVRGLVADEVARLEGRAASAGGVVLCTHRPVLPWVLDAVGIEDPELETGEMIVLHLRAGRVRAAERHLVT